MAARSSSPDFSQALHYVSHQMALLNELDAIAREETDEVAVTIFQRVLRATQEFRRVYAEHDYGIHEDDARIPLSRTRSEVSLGRGTVVQKPD